MPKPQKDTRGAKKKQRARKIPKKDPLKEAKALRVREAQRDKQEAELDKKKADKGVCVSLCVVSLTLNVCMGCMGCVFVYGISLYGTPSDNEYHNVTPPS